MTNLERQEVKSKVIGATVTQSIYDRVNKLCNDRNWVVSRFAAMAVERELTRLEKKFAKEEKKQEK